MKTRAFILFLMILSAAVPAGAANGKNSFETLNLTLPARFFALSGAGSALSDDISSCFINSSRLVLVKSPEITAGGSIHFDDSYAGYAAAAYPMPRGVFALSLLYFDYGAAELRSDDTLKPERLWSPRDFAAGLSFGATLFKSFSYGINLKYIQEILSPSETIFAFAADLNTHLNVGFIPGLKAAFLVNNIGVIPAGRFVGNPLPLVFVAGLSRPFELEKPVLGLYDIRPVLDIEANIEPKIRVLAGAEWCWYHVLPSTHLVLRTGVTWPGDAGLVSMLRMGAGIERRNFSFDYGIGWSQDLGFIHRTTLSFKWTAPPEKRYIRFVSDSDLQKDLIEIEDAMRSAPTNKSPAPRTDESGRRKDTPPSPADAKKKTDQTPPPAGKPPAVTPAPAGDDYDFEEE
jgi:hypothetical protein